MVYSKPIHPSFQIFKLTPFCSISRKCYYKRSIISILLYYTLGGLYTIHLWRALHPDFLDRDIGTMSYNEEYTGLVNEHVFRVISKVDHLGLLRKTGNPAISTMVVLIFKTNGLTNDPH